MFKVLRLLHRVQQYLCLSFRFSDFSIEYSSTCVYDYVAVYNGTEIDEKSKLAVLCGDLRTSPPIVQSTGNSMVVVFKTDFSGNYDGFRASVDFRTGICYSYIYSVM